MTDATGSKNQSSPASNDDKAPWERVWNDMAHGLSLIGEAMSDTFTPKSPPQDTAPWERPWGGAEHPIPSKKAKNA